MAGWATASSRDWKDTPGMSEKGVNPDGSVRHRLDQLPRQAALATSGATHGTTAATINGGACLNIAFAEWLMGYPSSWSEVI